MAKMSPRRRLALDKPEEVLTLAQRLMEPLRPYVKYLIAVAAALVVLLGAWQISSRIKVGQEEKAGAALAQVHPQATAETAEVEEAKALEAVVKEYPGTKAAREAQLRRAHLLYRLKRYQEAAMAYEALLAGADPPEEMLLRESLSYCYEGLGDFKKAVAVLEPALPIAAGNFKNSLMQRLAMLCDKAGDKKAAGKYWSQLVEQSTNPVLTAYLKEKAAAAAAGAAK